MGSKLSQRKKKVYILSGFLGGKKGLLARGRREKLILMVQRDE
jgi:hypothetical protein